MVLLDNATLEKFFSARLVVFFTGAGVSAESGIPTFRGTDGIWKKLKPEELANFEAFLRNPEMVWEWYKHRKQIVSEANPNPAHTTISDFQNIFPEVKVITQNIDNLHKRAGSKTVYELHGNIERNYCVKCKTFYNNDIIFADALPKCNCGGLIRPDVVWFGEYLPQDEFREGERAARRADIFIIVGTSAIVYPAASMIYIAKESGAYVLEINLERTEITHIVNKSFFGKAGEILPNIYKEIADNKIKA